MLKRFGPQRVFASEPGVSPGMFTTPQAAVPVAGPGVPTKEAPAPQTAPVRTSSANTVPAKRKPATKRAKAPKKKAAARKSRKPGNAASTAPVAPPVANRSTRVASIKLDMQTMLQVMGSTKKKDQDALLAIVAALNPLNKKARVRIMQAVAQLLTA